MFPASDQLSICFAHIAYRLHERFSALDSGSNVIEILRDNLGRLWRGEQRLRNEVA
jgi:hypothetical protein